MKRHARRRGLWFTVGLMLAVNGFAIVELNRTALSWKLSLLPGNIPLDLRRLAAVLFLNSLLILGLLVRSR